MLCDDFITIYHGRGNGLHGIFAIRAVPLFGHTLHLAALVLLTFHSFSSSENPQNCCHKSCSFCFKYAPNRLSVEALPDSLTGSVVGSRGIRGEGIEEKREERKKRKGGEEKGVVSLSQRYRRLCPLSVAVIFVPVLLFFLLVCCPCGFLFAPRCSPPPRQKVGAVHVWQQIPRGSAGMELTGLSCQYHTH